MTRSLLYILILSGLLKSNKIKVESVQLEKTLDLNLQVFSLPPRERVKCGGLGWDENEFCFLALEKPA